MSIQDYCTEMERLFAADMTQGEAQQPAVTSAKQKAWLEKAKSTIASLQGERKIRPFFNFTPAVRDKPMASGFCSYLTLSCSPASS